ncbi:hypothetical protein GCM10028819_33470 [Spirosoma humi]
MSQTLINIITSLAGQALSLGLAAFFGQYVWQYVQGLLKKVDDLERRVHRLECRDELRKELGIDKPCPTRPEPDKPQPA